MNDQGPVYLDLRLYPNRSLTRRQLYFLLGLVTVLCALGALRFWLLGAWPIAAFLLLDAGALALAFSLNNRAARGFEELRLDDEALKVRQVNHWGEERRRQFNPHWVKVVLSVLDDDENKLELRSHGQSLAIGQFLSAPERHDIAFLIQDGLARVRGAVPAMP